MASIDLINVHKYYLSGKQVVHAVDDLNIHIADGELLAVLGPSGCGKSSTMRMIAGLEAVTYGRILIDGKEVNQLTPAQRNIALAFESYALYQHMTIEENIGFCLSVRGVSEKERKTRVHEIADMLGISDILSMRPGSLSGGKQQLVSLARAIIRKPNVILFDEPISHLDTTTRLETSMKIRELHNHTGITMIYVTHNQEEALALADRIVIMDGGKLQQIGTREEIIEKPVNTFVAKFVGEPPINLIDCSVLKNSSSYFLISQGGGINVQLSEKQQKLVTDAKLDKITIGLRPRDLHSSPVIDNCKKLKGKLKYCEFLGENSNISLEYEDGKEIVASVFPDSSLKREMAFEIFFDPEKLFFFSPKTKLLLS